MSKRERVPLLVILALLFVFWRGVSWITRPFRSKPPEETSEQRMQRYRDEAEAEKAAKRRALLDIYDNAQKLVKGAGMIPADWLFLPFEEARVKEWGYEVSPYGKLTVEVSRPAKNMWMVETFAYDPAITQRIVFDVHLQLVNGKWVMRRFAKSMNHAGEYLDFWDKGPERLKGRSKRFHDFDWKEYRQLKEMGVHTKWD